MEKTESIYGSHLPMMKADLAEIVERLEKLREQMKEACGMDPVEHFLYRIKTEESMREKCRRKQLPETTQSALEDIHDAIGLRLVCAFLDDVYTIRDFLKGMEDCVVVEEKDYIRHAKPNGYRSYHMVLKTKNGYYAEFQLRTISMDTWAALEHHLRYKKQIKGNTALIEKELKRCADELASTDVSMQTIRDMIFETSRS